MKDLQYWIEPLIAHNLAYQFLGRVFYAPPSGELITTVVREDLFEDWPLPCTNEQMNVGLDTLHRFSQDWQDDQLSELKRDYARLFIGPGKLLAAPWESVYRSVEGLIFEQQTLEVRQFYRRYGMTTPNPKKEPEDHIGLELLFVAHLCALGLQAIEQGNSNTFDLVFNGLRNFYVEHLRQWADQCLARVQQHAKTTYYQGVATLASGCIAYSMVLLEVPCEIPMV